MSIDVVDLRNFYAQRLGVVARHFVGRGIRRRWTDTSGLRVLGIGYATPYLGLFREEAERCLAFMPAAQGVVKWPTRAAGAVGAGRRARTAAAGRRGRPRAAGACAGNVARRHRAAARGLAGAGVRRTVARGGAEPARAVGAHGHDAVRPRPALFALADHAVCCARPGSRRSPGARRCTCRRSRAAGSCVRRWRGSAPARPSRRRSPASTSSRRPSRSIARFRRAARSAVWCRRSSRCWRPRRGGAARQSQLKAPGDARPSQLRPGASIVAGLVRRRNVACGIARSGRAPPRCRRRR